MEEINGSAPFSEAACLLLQLLKCHPALRPETCALNCKKHTWGLLAKGLYLYGRLYSKSPFAHVQQKPPCQTFGLHVQRVWSTFAARYPLSSQVPRRLCVGRVPGLPAVPQGRTLQECQTKALRTASGNLSHPQMFTRLDKWSCRPMFTCLVLTAVHCAIMSST